MIMKNFKTFAWIFALAMIFVSCSKLNNNISCGNSSEMLCVTQNDEQWNGIIGDTIRKYLGRPQYGLPQPESCFDVRHVNRSDFSDIFQKFRNILIVEIDKTISEPIIETQEDWKAKPQIVVKIRAKDHVSWVEAFGKNKERIKKYFDEKERERYIEFYESTANIEAMNAVKKAFGFNMLIPEDYIICVNKDNYIGLKKTITDGADNFMELFIYQLPYLSETDLDDATIMRRCDSITEKYFETGIEGGFIGLQRQYAPPVFTTIPNFAGGYYAKEMRGMWRVYNGEIKAGPCLSYTVISPDREKIIYVEGFIYYPNHNKRDLLRQLEAFMWSLEF